MAITMAPAMVFVLFLISGFFLAIFQKWWHFRKFEASFRQQGVSGPRHSPFLGGITPETLQMRSSFKGKDMEDKQSVDILGRIMPEFIAFSKRYGVPYFFWFVHEPRIMVINPEHARELLSKQAVFMEKSVSQRHRLYNLIGNGLATVEGQEWAHHRRVVSPAFHLEKLKGMIRAFEKCTENMLDNWQHEPEVEVSSQFTTLTSDIISHTAFGSSYEKGQRVFQILSALSKLFAKSLRDDWIPFSRRVPTQHNRTMRRLNREVDSILLNLIQERRDSVKYGRSSTFGDDLLGLMLAESDKNNTLDNNSLVGECKTFYFAGHATTAALLRWATYLLAANPEWQNRAREEVLGIYNNDKSWNMDVLNKLKLLGMILYETLRLCPPVTIMSRSTTQDIQLGDLVLPKGSSVEIPIVAIHHDKELWGEDASQFNPERFRNGVSRASKHPNAFMAFSFGPRICIGQSFALLEAKLVMAMLLKRFSFSLSPTYRHCPVNDIGIRPFYGIQINLKAVDA